MECALMYYLLATYIHMCWRASPTGVESEIMSAHILHLQVYKATLLGLLVFSGLVCRKRRRRKVGDV